MARVAIVLLCICFGFTGPAWAGGRVALLIGNGAYRNAALTNPVNDVTALRASLVDAGFDSVDVGLDLGRSAMLKALDVFTAKARNADIAVVFYSGHGIEIGGSNYLIPTDAQLASDRDVKYEAVALDDVLAAAEGSAGLKLIILDACRDNPFLEGMRRVQMRGNLGKGLARAESATPNMLIAYATAPGRVAADGTGDRSPFTAALARHLTTPGLDVRIALGKVRDDVIAATRESGDPQIPYLSGSVGGHLVALAPLTERPELASLPPKPQAEPAAGTGLGAEAAIRADFDRARSVGSIAAWNLFINRHPEGFYTDLARIERDKVSKAVQQEKPRPLPTATQTRPATKPAPNASKTVAAIGDSAKRGEASRPDPNQYSKTIWPPHTVGAGRTVSSGTPFGNLTCVTHPPGVGFGRRCSWN
ncbi:caspase family protein [Prosthecomicrobium hirschii]|uniref:caspase family protein n=1 Tax=Prosthecodimorpha hirschii TaxID=665126 RepID=UPI002221281C|nr:caspase family protein [Prosthecomicrobium hirschii]MCW1840953.1 caspase family protein [Prosthecomicrobium hirschii]